MSPAELQDPFLRKKLPPESKDPLVLALLVLGVAVGSTWAMCVMLVDDLHRVLPNGDFEYRFAVAYKAPCLLLGLIMIAIGTRVNFRSRILPALVIQAAAVMSVMNLARSADGGTAHPLLLTLTVAVAGAGQAVAQGSLSGFCGCCPERYTRAFLVGLGLSSVVGGLLKLA